MNNSCWKGIWRRLLNFDRFIKERKIRSIFDPKRTFIGLFFSPVEIPGTFLFLSIPFDFDTYIHSKN